MQRILVKLGKLWSMLIEDGCVRTFNRLLSYLFVRFSPVKPGQIIFIANGLGDSALYRTRHVAEHLNFHGYKASVISQDARSLERYVDQFEIFVFHRVSCDRKIQNFLHTLKKKNKTIVFETDDLTFDLSQCRIRTRTRR